jgi:hypothetical protein
MRQQDLTTGATARADRSPRARRLLWLPPALVVALFLLSGAAAAVSTPISQVTVPAATSSGHGVVGPSAAIPEAALPSVPTSSAAPTTGGGSGSPVYVESGAGTFFNNTAPANVTTGHGACLRSTPTAYPECWNATLDPTVNVTTTGTTGLAYTVWTNDSPCAAMSTNATTEIEFTSSTNFGTSWGTPQLLGNPICTADSSEDQNYTDAEMPSLTSLSNGTFVLAYIESNISKNAYYYEGSYPLNIGCEYTDHDRVVVSESYNGGSTWTLPFVIQQTDINYVTSYNCDVPGMPLLRPSITATGNTVYLAYTEYPCYFEYYDCSPYQGYLHLVVSTNGGSTWSTASVPPTVSEPTFSSTIAAYPDLIVAPSGKLYVAYSTGFAYQDVCITYCDELFNASIVVAWSTNNGTTFTESTVTQTAYFYEYQDDGSEWLSGPYPELAYNTANDQVYVTYSSVVFGTYCYIEVGGTGFCDSGYTQPDVYFSNSSNGGLTWSVPVSIDPGFINPTGGPMNSAFLPSIGVLSDGVVGISYVGVNDSQCISYYCGAVGDFYVSSSNNGTNWSQPALVDDNVNATICADCTNGLEMFSGVSTVTATAGDQVLLAWPHLDNGVYGYAYWGGYGAMNVETSRLYTGAGITVSFSETGLPLGNVWRLSAGDFNRDGPSGSTLSLSGVPPLYALSYSVSWVNTSYGVAWTPASTPGSPVSFSKSSAVAVTFSEIILINLITLPGTQTYIWGGGYSNYDLTPLPGQYWVPPSTTFGATLTPATATFCYPCLNLTFISWVGSGVGSYTGTSLSISITPAVPVNETATFTLNGYCYPSTTTCYNYTYSQSFVESGLPIGTAWGVSLESSTGTITPLTGTTDALSQSLSSSVTTFTAWTVPSATPGQYWIPSTSAPSAFSEPNPAILINYTLGPIAGVPTTSWVMETGLPNGTAWTFQVGSLSSGSNASTSQVEMTAGGSELLNASSIYFEDGNGYYLQSVSVDPLVINASGSSVTPGGTASIDGPAILTYNFAPMFLVTIGASLGGTVSGTSQWVAQGSSISLTATPGAGYHFVSWSGSGSGSTSSGTTPTIVVKPGAPVTEFATFRLDLPPTWNVTLVGAGLPAGTAFTIVVGGTTYTSVGSVRIGNLSAGNYSISAPTISANASNTTQFVPLTVTSSTGLSSGVLDLTSNATLTVTYQTQYAVSLFSTPGGSISGYSNGILWETAGTSLGLTAVPSSGYAFIGWSGTVASSSLTITVPINGVSNETAQFLVRPTPPVTSFTLTVTETGLPANTAWAVSAGTAGTSGTTSSLSIPDLNGSYQLTASPLFPSTGVRWVSNATNLTESVGTNLTISVIYWEQFQVSVSASLGGSATPGAEWANVSSTISLTATPNSTSDFVSWNGSGTGSYSGTNPDPTVTVTGPIQEQANFAPKTTSTPGGGGSTSQSNTNGETTTVLVVVGLLVAGLVVGLLVGRRRPPAPSDGSPPAAWSGPETAAPEPMDSPADTSAPSIYEEGSPPA